MMTKILILSTFLVVSSFAQSDSTTNPSGIFQALKPALAQEASVSSARLIWYGVYQAGSTRVVEDKTTLTGTRTVATGIVPPKVNHERIPAVLNSRFGFGYMLEGQPSGGVARIRHVRKFPASGILNPKTGERQFAEEVVLNLAIDQDLFTGYQFEKDFELVPGVWKFEVWQEDRKLLEKSFTVYAP